MLVKTLTLFKLLLVCLFPVREVIQKNFFVDYVLELLLIQVVEFKFELDWRYGLSARLTLSSSLPRRLLNGV